MPVHRIRRNIVLAGLASAFACRVAAIDAVETDAASARIVAFYDVLLDTMKSAQQLSVQARYEKLEPSVRATFDLQAMTRIAVGLKWRSFAADEQRSVAEQFARLTIATYANRFDGYSGERFEVEPQLEVRGADRLVHSRLIQGNGEPIALNYLMRMTNEGWQAIDVYLSGTISELATRRSEFSALLADGGASALAESLRIRADKLLAG